VIYDAFIVKAAASKVQVPERDDSGVLWNAIHVVNSSRRTYL